jgi:hypothetical protein
MLAHCSSGAVAVKEAQEILVAILNSVMSLIKESILCRLWSPEGLNKFCLVFSSSFYLP